MDNETTLEQRLKAERATKDAMLYERMIEAFMLQWAPKDHYDRARFESQLTGIVRQTMLDVHRSMNEQTMAALRVLSDAASLTAVPRFIYPKDDPRFELGHGSQGPELPPLKKG